MGDDKKKPDGSKTPTSRDSITDGFYDLSEVYTGTPVKSGKKPRRIEERTVLLVRCGDRYVIRQRPEKGLLAGLWEFPAEEGSRTEKEAADLAQSMGVKVREIQFATTAKHVFTHVEWHMKGYLVTCDTPPEGAILATREELLSRYAIPRAYAAFLQWIGEEQKD